MTQPVRKKISKFFFYIVLGLSVLAMIGFGITGIFSKSTSATVATVGTQEVTAQEYFQTLQRELQTASQQVGQQITIQQAIQFGMDRRVLQRLITQAAFIGETERLGISVGDKTVQQAVLDNPAFQGADGKFDRTNYKDIIKRSGLTEAEYEKLLREDASLKILRAGVGSGAKLPDVALRTVFDFMGEKRAFTYARITADALPRAVPTPDDAELNAFYTANPDMFTQPLTRKITYVSLTPDMVAANATVSDAEIKALYDSRSDQYDKPAKRFLERIVFDTPEEATTAKARIDSGEATFDTLMQERGLTRKDVDLGEVLAGDLGDAAATALFATSQPGVYGPIESDIGPALFRIDAAIDATVIPLSEVSDTLKNEIALKDASGIIADVGDKVIDLIAGGATLEDVANESDMQLATIDLAEGNTDGIAAYAEFRDEASAAAVGEERDIVQLSDGGIFALRVDKIIEPFVKPFDEVRNEVLAKWTDAKTKELIMRRAEQIKTAVLATDGGSIKDFADSLQVGDVTAVTRTSSLADLPPAIIANVFGLKPGDVSILENYDGAVVVQLDSVSPFDPTDPNAKGVIDQVTKQANDLLAQDIVTYFGAALVAADKPTVNQARIDALHTQMN